ncbi:MAG TPA: hypothetical protein VLX92_16405 [Kofleriaceae bacterium]|nr:hypothetical protein [Kofleriaceae bacterium]
MAKTKSDLTSLVHPLLADADHKGVTLIGYLGNGGSAGKFRLYSSLADRTHYVEFSADDVAASAKHGEQTAILLEPDAQVTSVSGATSTEARYLSGAVSTAYMGAGRPPVTAIPPSLDGPICVTSYTCLPTCHVTCHATCVTCSPEHTCAHTCAATCAATCANTCAATCAATCAHTCAHTCVTCVATCAATCHQTCAPTCNPVACRPTFANTHCYTCAGGCVPTRNPDVC